MVRPSRRALKALLSDEGVLEMELKKNVILRSPQSGRLEGRTAVGPI